MNKLYHTLLVVLIALQSNGQGLKGEIGFNAGYNQLSEGGVACNGEFSYFVKQQWGYSSSSGTHLVKVDTLQQVIWQVPIIFYFQTEEYSGTVETIEVKNIIASENGGVYISGYANACCDCALEAFWFIQKIESDGSTAWVTKWDIPEGFHHFSPTKMSNMTISNNQLYVNKYKDHGESSTDDPESRIYSINVSDGVITDSLVNLDVFQLQHIQQTPTLGLIASQKNKLYALDSVGNHTVLATFSPPTNEIMGVVSVNDTIFVLTTNGIFSYSHDATLIHSASLSNSSNISNLKSIDGTLRFSSGGTGQLPKIVTLNHQLQVVNTIFLPYTIPNQNLYFSDFNVSHCVIVNNFQLAELTAIRYLDFSLLSNQNAVINRTDIGITDLDQYIINLEHTGAHFYRTRLSGRVLVENFGDQVMTECRINHRIELMMCYGLFYSQRFTGLNVAPGESVWIDLGQFHDKTELYLNMHDGYALSKSICVYSSHPNGAIDLNVSNDKLCKNTLLGYLDVDELTLEQPEKKLVKIVDLMGREIKEQPNTLMIYIYDDGTTNKILKTE